MTSFDPPTPPAIPPGQPPHAAGPNVDSDVPPWLRLSWRALLRGALSQSRELLLLGAALIISTLFGRKNPNVSTVVMIAAFGAGFSVLSTIFTVVSQRYRLNGDVFERREGILGKRFERITTERIRTVAVNRSLIDRVLGLATVEISTGTDGGPTKLDGLTHQQAVELNAALVASRDRTTAVAAPTAPDDQPFHNQPFNDPSTPVELARYSSAWVWRAALSRSSLAGIGLLVAATSPLVVALLGEDGMFDAVGQVWRLLWQIPLILLGLPVVLVIVEGARYMVTNHNFVLRRTGPHTLATSRGLVSINHMEINTERMRGATITDNIRSRALGAAELRAELTTGSAALPEEGSGSSTLGNTLLPSAPLAEVHRICDELLTSPELHSLELQQHGPIARRRLLRGSLIIGALCSVAAGVTIWFNPDWRWPLYVLAAAWVYLIWVARAQYRHLGHALTNTHVVVRSGGFTRTRSMVERRAVIGLEMSANIFQRRAGVTTLRLMNTTDGYTLDDVTTARATEIVNELKPDLVAPFVVAER